MMGNCCFRKMSSTIHPKNVTLLLVGLDNSGKTTIAKRLAGEPIDCVVPTIGFSVITLKQRGCRVSIYDLGGGPQIRDIWPRYYADVHGVIFVVDASDEYRIDECKQVLRQLLENEKISRKPILLLANKQDLEGALDEIDVVDRLNLENMVNEMKCPTLVELSSAIQFSKNIDIGLDNGYKWLIRSIMRDYPALNNRVLKDFAKQEEENRVQFIKTWAKNEKKEEIIANQGGEKSLKSIRKVLEEKKQFDEITSSKKKTITKMQSFTEEIPDNTSTREINQFSEKNIATINPQSLRYIRYNLFQPEVELLKDVANQNFKNFMVRPKSSGARLNGARSDKKKRGQKRRPLKKLNIPNFVVPLVADCSNQNQQILQAPHIFSSGKKMSASSVFAVEDNPDLYDENNLENTNPFVVTNSLRKKKIGEEKLSLFEGKVFHNKTTQATKISVDNFDNVGNEKNSNMQLKTHPFSKGESLQSMKVNGKMNFNNLFRDVTDVQK